MELGSVAPLRALFVPKSGVFGVQLFTYLPPGIAVVAEKSEKNLVLTEK